MNWEWNYRVVKKESELGPYYQIYEAYYEADGELITTTVDPIAPMGDSVEGLKRDIELMLQAFARDIIKEDE